MDWNPLSLLVVVLVVMLGAAFFSTFSLVIACLVKTQGALHGHRPDPHHAALLRQQRHLPDLDHAALAAGVSRFNPLTYQVDALRGLMISGGSSVYGAGLDILVLTLAMAVLVAVAAKLYPTLAV